MYDECLILQLCSDVPTFLSVCKCQWAFISVCKLQWAQIYRISILDTGPNMSSITLSRKGGINVSFVTTLCLFLPLRFTGFCCCPSLNFKSCWSFSCCHLSNRWRPLLQTCSLSTILLLCCCHCALRNYRELAVAFLHVNGVLQDKKMCLLSSIQSSSHDTQSTR